jgi:hypothetical protein
MQSLQVTLTDEQLADLARRIAAHVSSRPDKILFTEKEAAEMLGVSPCSLRNWRCSGKIQAATRGKPCLYRRTHIDDAARFLESRATE